MTRLHASLLACVVSVSLTACGGKVIFDASGQGGAGGSSTHASTSKATSVVGTSVAQSTGIVGTSVGPQTSVVGPGPSASSGTSGCDTGQIGDTQSPICNDCVNCAANSICNPELNACEANADCSAWMSCAQNCTSQPCYDQCQMQHPAGVMIYQQFIDCVLCSACPNNCNYPQACVPAG